MHYGLSLACIFQCLHSIIPVFTAKMHDAPDLSGMAFALVGFTSCSWLIALQAGDEDLVLVS